MKKFIKLSGICFVTAILETTVDYVTGFSLQAHVAGRFAYEAHQFVTLTTGALIWHLGIKPILGMK